ncbi:PA14 domain-containing protein [Streptomyces sp. HUAS 31]|uniref:PA14 domain-containing protein n=1 Tax=Streptomyces TaxID=1883 RepID=UPI002305A977|nr:PA14 domain-containing protein [Streptomyces sp. HUAS 31]WCD98368.1 PA14 domain-containing protein [Streptomyces sp. HUAS 31]
MNPARRTTAAAAATVVLATAGTLLSTAPASAAVSCASPVFKRQFFANTSFSGTPKRTDCDTAIDQNWGTNAPASGLPKDNFTVRWTVTRDFGSGGPFTFAASTQDGIRVYLDGSRKVDLWKNVSTTAKKTVDLTVPAGEHTLRIDYVNWTGAANVKLTYTPRTSATVDKIKPLAPTGAKVTYDTTTGKAKLTWSKSPEMDLAGYRVYRRLKDTSTWKKLTTTTATSYTDTPPPTGQTYYYEIRAVDRAGNESTGTADRPVSTPDRTAPATPSGVAATSAQPGIKVSWNAVPGATKYLVHRRWEWDGEDPVVRVATVTATSWLDTTARENLEYSYWVTAVDAVGNASAKSPGVYVARGDWAPSAPIGVTATTTSGGVALTWKPATTPVTEDLSRFRIYRNGRFVEELRAGQTSYTDNDVRHSTSYAYTVTAVDTLGQESTASAPATGTAPATGLAPAAVSGLSGAMDGYDIELRWQPSSEEDVDSYRVYRGQLVDGAWEYEEWEEVHQTWRDEPLYYSHEVFNPTGTEVRWAVVAEDSAGNSLPLSGEDFSYVTVTEPVAPPEETW